MTAAGPAAALPAGVALMERALGYTLGSLQLVTPELVGRPTPCRDWDLGALLWHMHESLRTLHEAIVVGRLGVDADGPPFHSYAGQGSRSRTQGSAPAVMQTVRELRSLGCRLVGAWVNAGDVPDVVIRDHVLSPSIVAAAGATEIAVHGWDVGRACGADRPIPPDLAEEILWLCPLFVTDDDRGRRFAAPVRVPAAASPSDRLVAFLGRRP